MTTNSETLQQLYLATTGHRPTSVEILPGAGSNRRYYRLRGTPTLIGVCGTSVDENKAFIYMARHFEEKGLPVPHVHATNQDLSCYLQDDLGNTLLFDAIAHGRETGRFDADEVALLRKTIRLLPRLQCEGAEGMDFSVCHPQPEFNRRSILWDLSYFKYCFLKATGLEFQEDRLEDDYEKMCDILLSTPTPTFMYRDFQSRNVMVRHGEPFFIDFQGGRKGPVFYDVASFLWQAKAHFSPELRNELMADYLDELRHYLPMSEENFRHQLRHYVLFRTLQVLGAYGFRGYFERKPHFLQSVPFAVENLRQLLAEGFPEYPYLSQMLEELTNLPQFVFERNKQKLTVRVMSFSYRKGIPEDPTGNGGGYVFDCRAVHNPGRYEQYRHLTGRDEPVIRFLEEDGEILTFLAQVDTLVDAHVQRYLERGFEHLMVCFGCTGGQHRSVYAAEHVARHLHEKFGIRVELEHREQQIHQFV